MPDDNNVLDSGRGSRPVPDPTILTTEQLLREVAALRSYVDSQLEVRDERLGGIDRATSLFRDGMANVTSEIDVKVLHLREVTDVRFDGVALQFLERDTRSERESRDNKVAVDAAFAAQKEAAAKQDEANQKAIDKSEKATGETLNKQADLFKSTTDALADKIDDLRTRLGMIDATLVGFIQRGSGGKEAISDTRSNILAAITVILAILTIVGFAIAYAAKP